MNEVFKIFTEKKFTCQNSCLTSIFRQFWNLEYHGKNFILFVFYGITILHGQNIDRRMDTITSRDRCVKKKHCLIGSGHSVFHHIFTHMCQLRTRVSSEQRKTRTKSVRTMHEYFCRKKVILSWSWSWQNRQYSWCLFVESRKSCDCSNKKNLLFEETLVRSYVEMPVSIVILSYLSLN